jgi:hypothetical protein
MDGGGGPPVLTRYGRSCIQLVVALSVLATGCATGAPAAGPSTRWMVLGDRAAGPDRENRASFAAAGAPRQPWIRDLSTTDADLATLINRQLVQVGSTRADLYIVQLGPADAAAPSPLDPEQYGALISALLVTLRGRGSVIVGTIPVAARGTPNDRPTLADARHVRRVHEYNERARSAARSQGVTLVEQEYPRLSPAEAAARSEVAWRSALASGGRPAAADAAGDAQERLIGFEGTDLSALRERVVSSIAAGGRLNMVAKIGDSNTATPTFLAQVSESDVRSSPHEALTGTFLYFSQPATAPAGESGAEAVAGVGNDGAPNGDSAHPPVLGASPGSSLKRTSLAAGDGWRVEDVLGGGTASPLARELAEARPVIALVMLGTNDLTTDTLETFESSMDSLLHALGGAGVIPILSTIPARADEPDFARRVPRFNAAIRALAAVHGIPLIDYAAAASALPGLGLSADGIHPCACPDGAGSFSAGCLRYGANLRNLLTLQALDRLLAALRPADGSAVAHAAGP